MITENHRKEGLNRAIVHAIASFAGVNPTVSPCDIESTGFDYGTDGTFSQVAHRGKRRFDSGFKLGFQLKATINWKNENGKIKYNLEKKTYNDMVIRNGNPACEKLILLLYCMPANQNEWLEIKPTELLIRHCCYYKIITGKPYPVESGFEKIEIPETDIFDAVVLNNLFSKLETGELI